MVINRFPVFFFNIYFKPCLPAIGLRLEIKVAGDWDNALPNTGSRISLAFHLFCSFPDSTEICLR